MERCHEVLRDSDELGVLEKTLADFSFTNIESRVVNQARLQLILGDQNTYL